MIFFLLKFTLEEFLLNDTKNKKKLNKLLKIQRITLKPLYLNFCPLFVHQQYLIFLTVYSKFESEKIKQ